VGMHATVLYRRQLLLDAGGFEPGLAASEDNDVFLRLSRQHPVASYGEVVAEYRKHGANTSNRAWLMLTRVLKVHARQRPYAAADPELLRDWRGGRSYWAGYYLRQLAREWRDRCMRRRPAPDPAFGVRECT
jgi:hypothetical protein